ncbi:MAG TPA: winged helix-turn-helix domain-containing protein, partial [Pyrinomonadaceae bacterium]|nr:winged helix-turn-helix domain-containing protein [Pyrinomonadaceae bacterium]
MSRHSKHFYEFDGFRLDVTERLLFRDGEMISLTQKAFELLLVLVENNNRIVEKGELMLKVWPDSFVEEGNLTQNIYQLRKALGQATDRDGYIKTIPRRGYRFGADVREWREDPQPFKPPTWAAAPGVTENNPSEMAVDAAADGAGDRQTWPSPRAISDDRPKGRAGRLLALTASLILLAGGVFFVATSGKRPSTADGDSTSRQMSVIALTSAGNVSCAAISPDGRLIAYATIDKPQQSSLWVEQLDTASRQAILPPGGRRYHALTFTPDGRYLYYVAVTDDEPARTLYRVPILGGPAQKILGDVQTAVSFSPDGTQFVFRRALDERRESVLFIARADGGEEREIAAVKYPESFSDPSWSPDGQTIAAA